MTMRYVHTNLVARDWRKLAEFYKTVFNCLQKGHERDYAGQWLDEATGLSGARIRGVHLILPGYGENGPSLEIFSYNTICDRPFPKPDEPGFGHLAFVVDDMEETAQKILDAGGRAVGVLTRLEFPDNTVLWFQYLTDPEGNIVEIQKTGAA